MVCHSRLWVTGGTCSSGHRSRVVAGMLLRRCEVLTRASGQRMLRSQPWLGLLTGAHMSIRTAARCVCVIASRRLEFCLSLTRLSGQQPLYCGDCGACSRRLVVGCGCVPWCCCVGCCGVCSCEVLCVCPAWPVCGTGSLPVLAMAQELGQIPSLTGPFWLFGGRFCSATASLSVRLCLEHALAPHIRRQISR